MPMTATWQGLDQILAKWTQLKTVVQNEVIPTSLSEGGQRVEQQAKSVCPVRTGFLRDSIQNQAGGQGETVIVAQAGYAGYVERGTSRMSGRFYMQNGMMSALPFFLNSISSRIQAAL